MAKLDWRTRLNTSWRKQVFFTAARQFAKSRPASFSFGNLVAYVVALLIILATFLFAAIGIYLILFDFPNIMAGLIGVVFIWLAYIARPRLDPESMGMPRGTFPVLEETLDQISEELGAPKVKTIELTSDWTAAVWQSFFTRQTHLVLGLPLIYAASGAARSAIMAHEIAHLVNGDPQRGAFLAAARHTITQWLQAFGYEEFVDADSDIAGLGEVLRRTIAFVLFSLRALIDRGNFYTSQSAEYIADGLSKKVTGNDGMREALLLLSSSFHLDRKLKSFMPVSEKRGTETLKFLRLNSQLSEEAEQERTDLIYKELVRSDVSHPPTAYRLAFLETIGPMQPRIVVDDARWEKIEREFEPYLETLGSEVISRREVNLTF